MYEVADLHSQQGFPTNDAQLTTSYSFSRTLLSYWLKRW
jgi:hypothetical protein